MAGKAYAQQQREQVRVLLEAGRDEDAIEKETGVSDRTIRRWKLELERTGRIGKPPESRTGRHRVLSAEMEAALLDYHRDNPNASVDEMLWWLWESHQMVVGTRTIRRVFERKGNKGKARKSNTADEDETPDASQLPTQDLSHQAEAQYQSPYGPMSSQATAAAAEQHLAQALQQSTAQASMSSAPMDLGSSLPDDEETMQLQLQQILLQKREVELKLKLRQLQSGKGPGASNLRGGRQPKGASSLYNPEAIIPNTPKRDSRSKKKIEESKKRTAQRQERMLRDLERRSRRRDHLTAEWVQSKDIWPLRAQSMLADLMHQYGCYTFGQGQVDAFEAIYRELYRLVDLSKGDWVPQIHDEMLRERTKRKMAQLRAKMQKTGEIVGRTDGYAGFQKAEDYTGEQARDAVGDESEMMSDMQTQPGASTMQADAIHYQPVPDHHHQDMQASNMSYAHPTMMNSQGPPQYPLMDQHAAMLPYGQMSNDMNGQNGGVVM